MKATLILLSLLVTANTYAKTHTSDGGSNIGGGNNSSEYIATWCKGQSSLLRNFKDRAAIKVNLTGDYVLANKILNDGMIQALNSFKSENESFLAKSLARGLEISRNLEATSAKNAERKAMVINNILSSYYDFMINVVGHDLDLESYIPFIEANNEQMDIRAAHFEENFTKYASSQLDWILTHLTRETRVGEKLVITPVGDAKDLIKVAIILSNATALDLDESLWNKRFSCSISDLQVLNATLSTYDQGNKEMFDDEKSAVDYLSIEIKRISNNLRLKTSCN